MRRLDRAAVRRLDCVPGGKSPTLVSKRDQDEPARRPAPCRRPARHHDRSFRCARRLHEVDDETLSRLIAAFGLPADPQTRPPLRSTRSGTPRRSASPRFISLDPDDPAPGAAPPRSSAERPRMASPARRGRRASRPCRRPACWACRAGCRWGITVSRSPLPGSERRDRPDRRAAIVPSAGRIASGSAKRGPDGAGLRAARRA